jgi:hypothetical protein
MDWYNLDGPNVKSDWTPLISTSLYSAHYGGETVLMDEYTQFDLVGWPISRTLEDGFKCNFLNLMDPAIVPEFIEKMEEQFGESISAKSAHRRR